MMPMWSFFHNRHYKERLVGTNRLDNREIEMKVLHNITFSYEKLFFEGLESHIVAGA